MQTKFADVWGYRIRYLEQGNSEKTIVLVHGLGGCAERWLGVIPRLSSKYRVLALDIIGFGQSDKPSTDYTIEFFAKFLSEFIKTLGLRNIILIGTSLGGQIAAQYATISSNIERLILVSPSGMMKHSTPALDAYTMAALYPNEASAKTAFEMMTNNGGVDEFTVSDFVKRMSTPNAKLAFISSILGVKNSRTIEELDKIIVPTLLIWGDADRMIPMDYANQFLNLIKNCKFLKLSGYGHVPHVENPQLFAESVLEFLDSRLVLAR